MRDLDDWIEGYLKYTENSEPPETFKKWTAISTIAAVLKRKCYLRWGEMTMYPNMYIILVAPSGKARKGTAMKVGSNFLRKTGTKIAAEAITREALIREIAKSSETHTEEKTDKIHIHNSLTVVSPELTVFLGYNNVQLMADITDWYDCANKWVYRTKGKGTDELTNLWVNLLGATTPELVQSTLPQDAIGGGLTSRIIFVYEEDKGKLVPAPFLTNEDQEIKQMLENDLERIGSMCGEFLITEEFLDTYIEWYQFQHKNPPFRDQRFSGYMSRRATHLLKLCIIISAATREDYFITEKIFHYALDLLKEVEIKMPHVFSGFGQSKLSSAVAQMMKFIRSNKEVKYEELMKQFYNDVENPDQMNQIISMLSSMRFCKSTIKSDGSQIITYNENFKQ